MSRQRILQPRATVRQAIARIVSTSSFSMIAVMAVASRADHLDNFITNRMQQSHIVGLSLAVVQNGEIIKERGYGLTDQDDKTAVTPSTLFQAGSVSKPVAAFGVMRL